MGTMACWWSAEIPSGLVDDLAAGGLDCRTRALGDLDALERHRFAHGPREHDLGALGFHRHHARLFQRLQVDGLALDPRQLAEPHFGARRRHGGTEADLRQPPLNRHLAALEPYLVVAALAGALSLDAAAAGLALAGGGAAPHAQPGALGAGRGLQCVESHGHDLSLARLLDLEEMRRRLDHAAILRRVGDRDRLADAPQAEAARAGGDVGELSVQALDERDFQLLSWCCVHVRQPVVISSRVLPRFAAISSGERIFASAFTVARTTLIGL